MKLPKLFSREIDYDKLTFKRFIEILRKDKHPDSPRTAETLLHDIPIMLTSEFPMLTYAGIEKMKWGDIKIKVEFIHEKRMRELETANKVFNQLMEERNRSQQGYDGMKAGERGGCIINTATLGAVRVEEK